MAEDTEINTNSTNKALDKTSAALKKTSSGAASLAKAFGETAIKYATGLPTLEDTTKKTGNFGKAVGYLEGQLGVFNEMSQYGVTFGNELDKMTVKATAARMTQEQLSSVIKSSASDFTLFGASANQGLQQYLTNQAEFYDTMPLAADGLRRLGMTTEEINESMLTYDKISRMNNRRDMRSNAERNRSAAAFAEEMDLMAKLQGKSRKEMQAEMEARAREGRIIAIKSTLEADMADALDQNLQKAAAFGPGVESVMKDMMAVGVPSRENAKLFAMLGPEVQSAMRAMKAAQDAGNVEEYNRQMSIFASSMEKRGKDEDVRRMALLGGMNEYAQLSGDIISNTQTGMGAALADARATLEAEVAAGKRRAFTEEEVMELARKRAQAEQDAQKRDATPGSTKAVTDALIAAQTKAFETAEKVQVEATTKLYTELSDAASGFTKFLTETDTTAIVDEVLDIFGVIKKEILGASVGAAGVPQRIDDATMNAVGQSDIDALAEIKELEQNLQTAKPEDRQGIIDRIKELTTQINSQVINGNVTIDANGDVTVTGPQGPAKDTGIKMNDGTVGAFNKLFVDFGKKANAELHNSEMVANEGQMVSGIKAYATELQKNFMEGNVRQAQNVERQMSVLGNSIKEVKLESSNGKGQMSALNKSIKGISPDRANEAQGAIAKTLNDFAASFTTTIDQFDTGGMVSAMEGIAKEISPGLASVGSQLQGQVSSIRPQMQNMASSMGPQMQEMVKAMQDNMPDMQAQMAGFAEQLKGPMENMAKLSEEQLTVAKKGVNINDKQLRSSKAMIGNVFRGIG